MKTMSRWSGWLFRARSGYVLRDIAGEYLLIPVELEKESESQMAILNEAGKFLWDLLQEEQTVETMTQAITDAYEVTAEEAKNDICEFIDHLIKHKLLIKMEVKNET
jgi:hypothetical protein